MVGNTVRTPEQPDARTTDTAAQRPDAATTVVLTMRQLGVVGLPRNYELFYDAITLGSRELTDALSSLGGRPTQKQLDEVARRYLKHRNEFAVHDTHEKVAKKLDEIIALLRKERRSMETYGQILGETSEGLASRQALSRDFLEKIISVTATATKTSLENRDNTVLSINDKSGELQEVKLKLEEYKRLADTDPLTQLYNRRAFDRTLSAIYDGTECVNSSALMLIDIDRFKSINDRFGHPVGDRILQLVAGIVRSTVKESVFLARTGGEEFAVVTNGLSEDAVFQLAENIREAVMGAPFVNVTNGTNYGPVTVSLGICPAVQAQNPDDLYIKTDRALYASKAAGRNRSTRFATLSEGNFLKNWLLYRSS
jgi:diguanylate cyclase